MIRDFLNLIDNEIRSNPAALIAANEAQIARLKQILKNVTVEKVSIGSDHVFANAGANNKTLEPTTP